MSLIGSFLGGTLGRQGAAFGFWGVAGMTRAQSLHRSFPTLTALSAPVRWIGRSRRRIWGAVIVMLAIIAGPPLLWVAQLFGLPDIGEPFDVAAYRAFTIPDDRNAFVPYAQAATLLKSSASYLTKSAARVDVMARWSEAVPELRQWLEESREALAVYRQGVERPDALDRSSGLDRESYNVLRGLFIVRVLALLEASRLEEQGDMAQAWGWYRATLRTARHVGMHGSIDRRNQVQRSPQQFYGRLATWSKDPRTTPALIRRAVDDIVACEALARSDIDSLKAAYLGVSELLDTERNPGRNVPLARFRRFWNPDYQLNPEQIQAIWDWWRFLRHEPERSRRMIRLLTANWLAYYELPEEKRPQPDTRVTSLDFYTFGTGSRDNASAISADALDGWFDTAYDAQQVLQYLDGTRVRIVERGNHVDLLILLASELYRRDHGKDPPTPDALVGPYLKSLPAEYLHNGKEKTTPVSGRRTGGVESRG
jgi:hypothetical protein